LLARSKKKNRKLLRSLRFASLARRKQQKASSLASLRSARRDQRKKNAHLEERVLAVLRQKAQVEREVEVTHRLVEEPGVPRLVARHQREHLRDRGVALLQPAAELLVEEEAGELSGARPLEELDKDLARRPLDRVGRGLE